MGKLETATPYPGIPAAIRSASAGCIESANGRAFSDPSCGDLRGDEIAYDPKDQILGVIDGDPGFPFITFIDVSGLVTRPVTNNCLPVIPTSPYGPPLGNALGPINPSTCILGQIYYDGAPQNNIGVPVDDLSTSLNGIQGFVCPDPSNPQVNSGVSGTPPYITGTASIPCHHGPIVNPDGSYCSAQDGSVSTCIGVISPAGLGAPAYNPNTGHFLLPNSNATGNLTIGTIDEIDPRPGNPDGPVVINTFPTPNCMPTSLAQGPGDNFLVGCADHDGEAFPANEYVINGTTGAIVASINNVGGVDEVWYNPGDNRYYLAARDMLPGPVMGVIDAGTNLWLYNFPTSTNAHSIAVDPKTNHAFMPQQAGAICGTVASAGCIDVIGEQ
jgi:hypothetical protein